MQFFAVVVFTVLAACSAGGQGPAATPLPADPEAAAPPPPPQVAAGGAAVLSAAMTRSYFVEEPASAAAARLELEDYAGARALFAKAQKDASGAQAARLTLMVAVCDAGLKRWDRAAKGFAAVLPALPHLSDWLHFQVARALFEAGDFDGAMESARAVDDGSIVGADAALLIGEVLRRGDDAAATAAHYRQYLAAEGRPRRTEARYWLAAALAAAGEALEAAEIYRQLTVRAPLTRWAAPSRAALAALLPALDAADRERIGSFTAADHFERGMVYYDAMRNETSEADFEAALAAPGLTPALRCEAAYHRANSVFKQRNRTRAAPLFDEAFPLCRAAKDADLEVKSSYQAGRSYAILGQHELAAARYLQLERRHPEHSYADDARLRRAEAHRELGDDSEAARLLGSLPATYPEGDMRAEAMWRLAWHDYKNKRYKQAIGWLDKEIAAEPISYHWDRAGQPQYWKGRIYGHLGEREREVASYRETVELYPLSYYSLLALNRLRENHPDEYAALRATLGAGAGERGEAPPLSFKPRELYASAGFERALEFLRLGLGTPARAELALLGLAPPADRERLEDEDQIDRAWATAFLYDAAGRYSQSHWVARWNVLDYQRHWPSGSWRAKWEIAYPPAWWPLLAKHARAQGYPPELQIAFVREESAFNPLLESFANAIGLSQLILPTAARFAGGTGIEVTRESLRDPEKNVLLGSRFLGFLFEKWGGNLGLIIPSYNAGEGAVAGWLAERPSWPQDEFAEEIPYDETRGYNKRVTATYFTYSFLRGGTVPALPN